VQIETTLDRLEKRELDRARRPLVWLLLLAVSA
jgi:hypothetical protein